MYIEREREIMYIHTFTHTCLHQGRLAHAFPHVVPAVRGAVRLEAVVICYIEQGFLYPIPP